MGLPAQLTQAPEGRLMRNFLFSRGNFSVRVLFDAINDAHAWWDACRAADQSLPSVSIVRAPGGGPWKFDPPEMHGYFVACLEHRRQSLWAIASDRATRRARRFVTLVREILSLGRA